ncbi:MAG: alpha/beta hydrolase [Pseudomonadota bacterium]
MGDVYVLVHGAWHCGDLLEDVAAPIRAAGHECYCPTIAGNRPEDDRSKVGLNEAAQSIVDFIHEKGLTNVRLMGHSYGGMVISKVVDTIPEKITRLIYWSAFVPLNGQRLIDMVPPHYVALFDQIALANNGAVMLPPPIWREAFINDADAASAQAAYEKLNPHPYKTMTDPISLSAELATLEIGKSFVNCLQDTALPQSMPWHPRLSERLGLFRLVELPGSHEVCFTNPTLLAEKIMEAGRD